MTNPALAVSGCRVLASIAQRKTGVRISRRLVNAWAKLNGLLASSGSATNESLSWNKGLHIMKKRAQGADNENTTNLLASGSQRGTADCRVCSRDWGALLWVPFS